MLIETCSAQKLQLLFIHGIVLGGDLELGIDDFKSIPAHWESKYSAVDMQKYFGAANGASLTDVHENFSRLRAAGLILHYWPWARVVAHRKSLVQWAWADCWALYLKIITL